MTAVDGPLLRVLHVTHTGTAGGAEHALQRLLAALPGVESHVACPPGPTASLVAPFAVVHPLPEVTATLRLRPVATPRSMVGLLRVALRTRALVRSLRPDVVHANTIRSGLVCALVRRGPRVVVHVRDAFPEGRTGRILARVLRVRADLLVSVSPWVADTLPGPSVVVPDCVDPAVFDTDVPPAEDLRTSPDARPLLGVVAQITPWKGQDLAIDVLAALRARHPAAELVLVGDVKFEAAGTTLDNRSFRDGLDEQVVRLCLADVVRFTGERSDVPALIRALDVLLVPSSAEPFGLTVIEAMACGTPVVATSEGGPSTTIRDGVDGFLAPPGDVEAWTAAVERALAADGATRGPARDAVLRRFTLEHHARDMRAAFEGRTT